MKLYADGVVYLQNYDLAFMITEKRELPMCIYQEIKAQVPEGTERIDLRDEYNFAWQFRTVSAVEWLTDCRYILDYGELRFCTLNDLDELLLGAYDAWYGLAMSCEGVANIDPEILAELQDFGHIIQSLMVLIQYRQGQTEFPNLPEEYRAPVFPEVAEEDDKYFGPYYDEYLDADPANEFYQESYPMYSPSTDYSWPVDGFFPGFDRPIKRRTQGPGLHRRLEHSRRHKL
ncbi:hypothetical protein IKE72_02240 [Candidatus Saccharibacteria bacterium]|nr:hypothetical protein [Candidatus Saccharibacteria bacterium]